MIEVLDYSATETQVTPDIRALSIFANQPQGLLTISRIAAVIYGGTNKAQLVELVNAVLDIETPQTPAIDILKLGEVLERVESFAHASGGLVLASFQDDAPTELVTKLDPYVVAGGSTSTENIGFYL